MTTFRGSIPTDPIEEVTATYVASRHIGSVMDGCHGNLLLARTDVAQDYSVDGGMIESIAGRPLGDDALVEVTVRVIDAGSPPGGACRSPWHGHAAWAQREGQRPDAACIGAGDRPSPDEVMAQAIADGPAMLEGALAAREQGAVEDTSTIVSVGDVLGLDPAQMLIVPPPPDEVVATIYPVGEYGEEGAGTDAYTCGACGALVADPAGHRLWHSIWHR